MLMVSTFLLKKIRDAAAKASAGVSFSLDKKWMRCDFPFRFLIVSLVAMEQKSFLERYEACQRMSMNARNAKIILRNFNRCGQSRFPNVPNAGARFAV